MPDKLSFGYLYDFRNPPQWGRDWAELYADTLDVVAWTETVGFQGAWVPEHHLADDGYIPSPLIALSAIAVRTRRMKLGSAIALAPLYNPVRFAEDCAVLDIIAGGRLELGLAIGYRRRETAALGVDFGKRGRLFDEWLEIVTRLWAGEEVTFAGQHFDIAGARLAPPAPRGKVPLFLGGTAAKAMARVARYGDGYVGNDDVCGAYIDQLRAQGKDVSSARLRLTALFIAVAHDPEQAMEELAPYYHHVNNSYGEWFAEEKVGAGLTRMSLEDFKRSGALQVLTPLAAIERFTAMRARMPLEHVIMMKPPGLPTERFVHYAQLFADEVIPAFR